MPSSAVFALWECGRRGPAFALLHHRGDPPTLTDRENKSKIGNPIRLKDGDEVLPLMALMRLYPSPQAGEGPSAETIAKVRKVADDDRGDAATREVAKAQLRKWGIVS